MLEAVDTIIVLYQCNFLPTATNIVAYCGIPFKIWKYSFKRRPQILYCSFCTFLLDLWSVSQRAFCWQVTCALCRNIRDILSSLVATDGALLPWIVGVDRGLFLVMGWSQVTTWLSKLSLVSSAVGILRAIRPKISHKRCAGMVPTRWVATGRASGGGLVSIIIRVFLMALLLQGKCTFDWKTWMSNMH